MKRLLILLGISAASLAAAPLRLPEIMLPGLPSPADLARVLSPQSEIPAEIPEPATVLLVGAALLSIAVLRRRK